MHRVRRCAVLLLAALAVAPFTAANATAAPHLSLGSMHSSPTTAVASDPSADNAPGHDPRGDLLTFAVGFSGTTVQVGATVRKFERPTTLNWEGFAQGNPIFIDGTSIEWDLDRNGDDAAEFKVFFLSDGSRPIARVTPASDTTATLCTATPQADAGGGYFASFPSGCIGKPTTLRAQAVMTYETPTNVSLDFTEWTSAARPAKPGYWMVGSSGSVYSFGDAHFFGGASTHAVTDLEPTPSLGGYWIVNAAGEVFSFGNAHWHGNVRGLSDGETAVGLSATPSGNGYWLFTSRGRVLTFGDARFFGDISEPLNGPVVGAVATPTGRGYYLVASDGGIFTFGDARFHGSMGGTRLNQSVIGLVPTTDNRGYWLVARDGGVFSFNVPFRGSLGGVHLNQPIIGMVRYGNGYLMAAADGGVFDFSNVPFVGSLGSRPPAVPIVGVGATA